jgi:hypothetical protein
MRRKRLVLFIAGAILLMFYVNAQAFVLPDTGQTKCYGLYDEIIDCSGTGQDGAFSINPRSYTNNNDGTVTDNVTGLMWQRCSIGQDYLSCSGTSYCADGASNCCASVNLGGYTDWRVPAKKELITLVDYSIPTPGPTINSVFINTWGGNYDTATPYAFGPGQIWLVGFDRGKVLPDSYPSGQVRCVRGAQEAQSYTDNNNGTVTDNRTGLMWQKCSVGQDPLTCSGTLNYYNWWQASGTTAPVYNPKHISVCGDLSLAGYADWRLPNIIELESLTDDTRYDPTINITYFPNTASDIYWSSTSDADSQFNWRVDFRDGDIATDIYAEQRYVRCVRDNKPGPSKLKITAKAKGTGKGKVVSAPSGISFIYPKKKTGSGTYTNGSTVKVTAKANAGSKVSWNKTCKKAGGAEKGDNTSKAVCTIKVTKAATVKATFTKSKKAGDSDLEEYSNFEGLEDY